MKSAVQLIDKNTKTPTTKGASVTPIVSDTAKNFLQKLKSREVYPPKYPAILKAFLQKNVAEKMATDPDCDLKVLVLAAIGDLPDWAPPKLFVETVTWVTEAWEVCRGEKKPK